MKYLAKIRKQREQGSALVALIVILPFLILVAGYYMQLAVQNYIVTRKDQYRTHAQLSADAGVDYAVQKINADPLWVGTGIPGINDVTVHSDSNIKSTFEVPLVVNVGLDKKIVTAIGKTYSPATSPTPKTTVRIKVTLKSVTSGEYSVVAGAGGLVLSNQAKVLGGDVFVNGKVTMTGSSQIGLAVTPPGGSDTRLDVAHQSCPVPADATYPVICGPAAGQPISIANPAWIYADVRANNQTDGSRMSNDGLLPGVVVPQPMPNHDRATQKALATTPAIPPPPNPPFNTDWECTAGTYIWPANLKITGNVTIRIGCVVVLLGDVWITGNLEVRNSGQIVVSDLFTGDKVNIMVDGEHAYFRNTSALISNVTGKGVRLISYWRPGGCVPDTRCDNVTGADLFAAQNIPTIELEQSASGPKSIFYSRWTKVLVHNSGAIGALAGQTVELRNSGSITFGTSAGPGTTSWLIDDYRREF